MPGGRYLATFERFICTENINREVTKSQHKDEDDIEFSID